MLSALDQETATRVLDFIQNPPAEDKYTKLKKRLEDTFTSTEYERANRLLQMPPLGDLKPSQLMDQMLALLGSHPPCFLFRQIFLNHLPEHTRSVLMHSEVKDMRELAQAADRLHQAQEATAEVHRVSGKRPSKNTSSNSNNRELCFYHAKFKTKAKRCVSPCDWKPSPNSSNVNQLSENDSAGPQ